MAIYYISSITGSITIIASLYLLYKKRITLDTVSSNPKIEAEALKAEILDIIKISSNYPAVALFVIGLILIITPLIIIKNPVKVYTVRGTIQKHDGKTPRDISIMTRFPPFYPSSRGEITSLRVWKGPDGKFPTLSFVHPNYAVEPIDLNDSEKVKIINEIIKIKRPVNLLTIE